MTGSSTTAATRTFVDQALSAGWRHLAFPAPLERRFEQDTGTQRGRWLQRITLIGLLVYGLFAFDDFVMISDVARQSTLIRLGVITPIGLFVVWLLRFDLSKFWRESAQVITAFLCFSSIMYFVMLSHAAGRIHYFASAMLVIVFVNVVWHLRFPYAAFFSAASLAVFCVALAGTSPMAFEVKVNAAMVMLSTIAFTLVANYRLEQQLRRAYLLNLRELLRGLDLSETNRQLAELSNRDELTGLANRRFLEHYLAETWRKASVTQQPVALLMLDVDFFKAFNDLYGHPAGDECLKAVAAILREQMRADPDLLVRYGGEEFMAVMPERDLAVAVRIGERIRQAVEAAGLRHEGSAAGGVLTVSLGVAALRPSSSLTPDDLIAAADVALYSAKQAGRNLVWPPLAFARRHGGTPIHAAGVAVPDT